MFEELEIEIQSTLNRSTTIEDLKRFQSAFYKKIHSYEMQLYNENRYDTDKVDLIKSWRQQFRLKVIRLKESTEQEPRVYREDSNDLEETVHLVARQVQKAEHNRAELEGSTVKLKSLNMSSRDLQKEIDKTRRNINVRKLQEQREVWLIKIGFVLLGLVCLFILMDKLGMFVGTRQLG